MANPKLTPDLFAFLRELKNNNDRDWFKERQQRFEDSIREPLLQFVRDFRPYLAAISPHFLCEDKKTGGSLFRIHRDTRFGEDKTPYKTHAALHFRHKSREDVHAPGFYLHLEPGGCFAGIGTWRPPTKIAHQIREAIDADPDGWAEASAGKKFLKKWTIERDDVLKRPPQGFPADHPQIEDLKLKSFVAFSKLSEEETLKPGFVKAFAKLCDEASPFVRFLTDAVGEKWE